MRAPVDIAAALDERLFVERIEQATTRRLMNEARATCARMMARLEERQARLRAGGGRIARVW